MNFELDTQAILQQIREDKALTEAALQAEIESHLVQDLNRNRKNGTSSKTMKSDVGNFELDVPKERNRSFEPEIVKKNQTHMSDKIEKKIPSLYALGNSYVQISDHIERSTVCASLKPL